MLIMPLQVIVSHETFFPFIPFLKVEIEERRREEGKGGNMK